MPQLLTQDPKARLRQKDSLPRCLARRPRPMRPKRWLSACPPMAAIPESPRAARAWYGRNTLSSMRSKSCWVVGTLRSNHPRPASPGRGATRFVARSGHTGICLRATASGARAGKTPFSQPPPAACRSTRGARAWPRQAHATSSRQPDADKEAHRMVCIDARILVGRAQLASTCSW